MKKILTYGFMCLCIVAPSFVSAQVTIGSDKDPNLGALLDLKEDESTNIKTSVKGLGLPRVELKDLNSLTMGTNIIADNPAGTWAAHTGLTVYSISNGCVDGKIMYPGVYTWNGEEWMAIWRKKEIQEKKDVRTIIDNGTTVVGGRTVGTFTMSYDNGIDHIENKTYYYAEFGEAGIWMTQNLATRVTSDGNVLKNKSKMVEIDLTPNVVYTYPISSTIAGSSGTYDMNIAAGKEVGLLYNWDTAVGSDNCNRGVNQGQSSNFGEPIGENEIETTEPNGRVQGICPSGWHLPSDREWNELEKYLVENAASLTQSPVTANGSWTPGDETAMNQGTNIATVMKSKTLVELSSSTLSYANSKKAQEGGFDVYITGDVYDNQSSLYGKNTYFWTASIFNPTTGAAWMRGIFYDQAKITRYNAIGKYRLYSVRCKKN
ncbi:FISUMP domain-containing protein [uncultured Dysgonomonas sp.]|nr:FISUMP domain-containing protein [uncultured Dysgonomonas sp.]